MAYDSPQGIKLTGLTAAADLSASQYAFVKFDAAGNVVLAATQGEATIGVLQNKPSNVGDACEIIAVGVTKVKTEGTAHAEGAKLAVAVTTGEAGPAASADEVLGIALTTPTATAGVIFTALINCATTPVLA